MLRLRSSSLVAAGAAVLAAAAVAVPVAGHDPAVRDPPPPGAHADSPPDPPDPVAAPGETQIPPPGTAAEDELPLGDAERRSVLGHLREVAACARARDAGVPDPVSDAAGVHLSWSGPERPEWEAALRSCDDAIR